MIFRRILAAALSLCMAISPTLAQKSKATLQTEINTNVPDNTSGAITPAILRSTFADFLNSWQQYSGVNAQTGTSYTIQASDYGQLITFTNAAPVAVSLPQAVAPSFGTFNVYVSNLGAGLVTITPTISTINGGATFTVTQNQSVWIISDGANYQVWRGFGSGVVNTGTAGQLAWYPSSAASVSGNANLNIAGAALTLGIAGSAIGTLSFANLTSGTITLSPTAGALGTSVLIMPAANDQLVARATSDIFSNKTFDTAAPNTFKINTITVSAVTGTGNTAVLQTSPALTTPNIGVATAASINGNFFPTSTYTLSGVAAKTLLFNNTLTLAGIDATTLTFQGTDTYVGRATADTLTNKAYDTAGAGNVFKVNGNTISAVTGTGNTAVLSVAPTITGHPTIEGVTSTGATGLGNLVFATSATLSNLTATAVFNAIGLVTYADMATAAIASAAQYLAGTSSEIVQSGVVYQAETTTTFGSTTTFDFSSFINTAVTLTGNITTQTLTNVIAGKAGTIAFIQDGTGSRTTVWNGIFKFAGGTTPTLTTTAAAVDVLSYSCRSATFCFANLSKDVK